MTSVSVPTVLTHNVRALSNYQIESKMRHRKYFKGVYDADSLPRRTFAYPWAIIVNTKKTLYFQPDIGQHLCLINLDKDTILIHTVYHHHINFGKIIYI